MLFSDATALPVKPGLSHSIQGHAKIEMPLAGSGHVKVKGPSAESVTTISRRYSSVAAPSEHAHDVR